MPKTKPPLPFKKAGMMIHGVLARGPHAGEQAMIAPYSEGRFGDDDKYYMLPAGSIDRGESAFEAALREAQEETGINMLKLLTPEGIERLRRGEAIENLPSGYSGVTILRADPVPMDHSYLSRSCQERRIALFGVAVDGIEKLGPDLKNQRNRNRGDRVAAVEQPVRAVIDAEPGQYPSFSDFLTWMREERMPRRPWNKTLEGELPALVPQRRDDDGVHFFSKLEQRYGRIVEDKNPHVTRKRWQDFCERISGDEYSNLAVRFDRIKKEMKDLGIIGSDDAHVKLDDKDCPLFYFQEGADIVTTRQFMGSFFDRIAANKDFSKAHGGDCQRDTPVKPEQRLLKSQAIAVAPFVSKKDIRASVDDFKQSRAPAPWLRWGDRASTREAGYSFAEPFLAARKQMRAQHKATWQERRAGETPPQEAARG